MVKIEQLNFYKPNADKFPSLKLYKYLNKNRLYESKLIVINAANEIAVDSFLEKKINYLDIIKLITKTLNKFKHRVVKSLNDVILVDIEAREVATNLLHDWKN